MIHYVLRRLLIMIPTLLGVTLVVFVVMAFSPGGLSASNLITGQMEPEAKKYLEAYYNQRYGLDQPLPLQYLKWLNNISPIGFSYSQDGNDKSFSLWKGVDLGESMYYGRPVSDLLVSRVPITLLLNLLSLPIIYGIALFSGVYAARHRGSLYDRTSGAVMLGLWSMPNMLVGILLIGFLANDQYLHWFPVSGLNYYTADNMAFLPHWQNPADFYRFVFSALVAFAFALVLGRLKEIPSRLMLVVLLLVSYFFAFAKDGFPDIGVIHLVAVLAVMALALVVSARIRFWCFLLVFLIFHIYLANQFNQGELYRGFLVDRAWHLVLPVICLSYGGVAYLSKLTRSSVLENLRADFTRTARAKGLSEPDILWQHVFRNSLLPLITVAATLLPGLLAGSIIVETLFSIEGMGKLAVDAVKGKDRELVLSITLISGVLTLVSYLLADIFYALADPRVSYERT